MDICEIFNIVYYQLFVKGICNKYIVDFDPTLRVQVRRPFIAKVIMSSMKRPSERASLPFGKKYIKV